MKSSDADENELRNAMFNELLDRKLNLEFPTDAKCREEKKDFKPTAENNEKKSSSEHTGSKIVYREEKIGVALSDISEMTVPNPYVKDINKLEQGMLVTATYKPDMMVLNPISDEQRLYELIQGEFKHAATYQKHSTERQCFAYLYAALYWFRVEIGRASCRERV